MNAKTSDSFIMCRNLRSPAWFASTPMGTKKAPARPCLATRVGRTWPHPNIFEKNMFGKILLQWTFLNQHVVKVIAKAAATKSLVWWYIWLKGKDGLGLGDDPLRATLAHIVVTWSIGRVDHGLMPFRFFKHGNCWKSALKVSHPTLHVGCKGEFWHLWSCWWKKNPGNWIRPEVESWQWMRPQCHACFMGYKFTSLCLFCFHVYTGLKSTLSNM